MTTYWINTKNSSFSVEPHHFSRSLFIDVLCKSVDAPTEITYVLGLLLLHILRTLVPKRIVQWWKVWRIWWPMMLRVARDDSISKFRSQKWQTLCVNVAACSILLKPIFFPCWNILDFLLYCVIQNFIQVNFLIYRSIKPYNRKTPTVNNAHQGHLLFTVGLFTFGKFASID